MDRPRLEARLRPDVIPPDELDPEVWYPVLRGEFQADPPLPDRRTSGRILYLIVAGPDGRTVVPISSDLVEVRGAR